MRLCQKQLTQDSAGAWDMFTCRKQWSRFENEQNPLGLKNSPKTQPSNAFLCFSMFLSFWLTRRRVYFSAFVLGVVSVC